MAQIPRTLHHETRDEGINQHYYLALRQNKKRYYLKLLIF